MDNALALVPLAPEACFLGIDHWSMCMTKAEWSGWVQAFGSIGAILFAVWLPLWLEHRAKRRVFIGHLKTIATDVRLADRQARAYLESRIKVPAYRLMLYGAQTALPWLLAEGRLTSAQATALVQWYVDARSFNYSLDIAQQLKNDRESLDIEYGRTKIKANHLVQDGKLSRFDDAITVLRQLGLPEADLGRIPLKVQLNEEEAQ